MRREGDWVGLAYAASYLVMGSDGMGWDGMNHVSCEYVRGRALIDY